MKRKVIINSIGNINCKKFKNMNLSQDEKSGLFSDNYNDDAFFQDGNGNDLVSNNQKASLDQSISSPLKTPNYNEKSILGENKDVSGKSAVIDESYNDDAFDDNYDDDDFNASPVKNNTIDAKSKQNSLISKSNSGYKLPGASDKLGTLDSQDRKS